MQHEIKSQGRSQMFFFTFSRVKHHALVPSNLHNTIIFVGLMSIHANNYQLIGVGQSPSLRVTFRVFSSTKPIVIMLVTVQHFHSISDKKNANSTNVAYINEIDSSSSNHKMNAININSMNLYPLNNHQNFRFQYFKILTCLLPPETVILLAARLWSMQNKRWRRKAQPPIFAFINHHNMLSVNFSTPSSDLML